MHSLSRGFVERLIIPQHTWVPSYRALGVGWPTCTDCGRVPPTTGSNGSGRLYLWKQQSRSEPNDHIIGVMNMHRTHSLSPSLTFSPSLPLSFPPSLPLSLAFSLLPPSLPSLSLSLPSLSPCRFAVFFFMPETEKHCHCLVASQELLV